VSDPPLDLASRFRQAPRVAARALGEETVLLDLDSGRYFDLDATGSRIWTLLAPGAALTSVLDALEAEYDAPRERLAADLVEIVATLERQGLVARLT
jgi:hypothetical protein